ncbi:Dyp-type peroxidase [Neptunicella sp. SCSIO 80796]|uniref:Dyp-type peroxidase n=1 Tax=Neptunicella plasticusilytica TaxID=3117012 RepID=UPI003A4E21B5
MSQPQKGICAEPNLHGLFLMFNVDEGKEAIIRKKLSVILDIFEHYDEEHYEGMVSGVIAIGSNYWVELFPGAFPKELSPFPDFSEYDRSAPVVPFDLFVQIRADRADICHAIGLEVCELLQGDVELVEQVKGFRFLDGRDLTGFVDGSDNPRGMKKLDVAIVGDEDPDFTGGSYIHVQRFQHNLDKWNRLSVAEQEMIMGRSKEDDVEFSSEYKATFSHSYKMSITDEQGQPVRLLRQSMPYGDMKVQGQYFISCARSAASFTRMLRNMIVADDNGDYDRLLDFTTAETGGAFFAPSVNFIKQHAK